MKAKKLLSLLISLAMMSANAVVSYAAEADVAKIGDTGYATFNEAITAANAMTDEVTVEIYGKVEYSDSTADLTGSYSTINFVGKTEDAEISITRDGSGGYISGSGSAPAVTFTDLILSKPTGAYANDAGFMNVYFTVYRVASVEYTNCTFPDGACAQGCPVTYTNCDFANQTSGEYSLWVYANTTVTVTNSKFTGVRGAKMYGEGAAKTGNLVLKNTTFDASVTEKPAIVLTYGESVILEGNTYPETGVFELDNDGDPNGTTLTADIKDIACTSDSNDDCGVLVDGKIYRTVTDAAAVATSGSTVTLMYDATETVELAEGVILDKNGYEAANVTVASTAIAEINGEQYATLEEAVAEAVDGDKITLLSDIALSKPVTIKKDITIDGDGHKITQSAECNNNIALLYFEGSENNVLDVTVKNTTFDGLKVGAAIRTLYVNMTIDNCVFQNCEHTVGQGLVRLTYGTANITNSKYLNNDCSMGISFNWDGAGLATDILTIDNCEFTGNTANKTALVYYVKGAGCEIKNSEFKNNTINCNQNGATIYLGFQENCAVTGNLFENNSVTDSSTSTRVGGAIFFGYEANISGNAFVNNTAANANGDTLGQVCTSTYYDCQIDLGGNYWGGDAPEYGKDYTVQHQTGEADFALDTYNTNYSLDENGNVAVSEKTEIEYVAQVGKLSYTSLQAAVDAATEGQTVKVIADIALGQTVKIPTGKKITLDLNGKTISFNPEDWVRAIDNDTILAVSYGAELTIDDTSADKTGSIDGTADPNDVFGAVKVTLAGDTDNSVPAKLTVNGGTLSGYYYGVVGNGGRDGTEITINGGTVKATGDPWAAGIYHPQNGTLTIKDGNIEGYTGIYFCGGDINVSGGTITATGAKQAYTTAGDGFTSTGDALVIDNRYDGTATSGYGIITASITGGTFTTTDSETQAVASYTRSLGGQTAVTGFISGGTFSSDVSELCADGYEAAVNADGTYGIVEAEEEELKTGIFLTRYPDNGYTLSDGTAAYRISLFAGIDSLKYNSVGFDITVDGETREYSTDTVYNRIKYGEDEDGNGLYYSAEDFDGSAAYIYNLNIKLPKTFDNKDVGVRPFAYKLDGTKIFGKIGTIHDIYTADQITKE